MSNDNDKDQEYQKNMGKRLRKIRKENALSQDDVADALGICTKQYQRYEYGDSAISCEKLSILEDTKLYRYQDKLCFGDQNGIRNYRIR